MLTQKGLLPMVDQPYDQAKVDAIKTALKEIYKENGITVDVQSSQQPTNSPHAVRVMFEVTKI
jgi:maltose-binding protein MalE